MADQNNNKPAKQKRKFFLIQPLWKYVLLGFLGVFLLFTVTALGLFGPLPNFEEIENPEFSLASEVISSDNEVLGKIAIINRVSATPDEIPKNVSDALIATEDVRFHKHWGVDFKATLRAFAFLGKRGGGSTITQQLAKNLLHKRNTTRFGRIIQKLKEYVVAVKLERSYTKDEILTMYLNQVDFVNNAVGIKTASKVYFSKDMADLSVDEAATLVGMVKNPSYFDPRRRRELVEDRRNVVLHQLAKYRVIDQTLKDSLQNIPLEIKYRQDDHNSGLAPYLRSVIQNQVLKQWIEDNPKIDGESWDMYRDGLKIYTTIDSRMQAIAENSVNTHLIQLQKDFDKQNKRIKIWNESKAKTALGLAISNSDRYNSLKRANKAWSRERVIEEMNNEEEMIVYHPVRGSVDTLMSPMDSIKYHRTMMQSAFVVMDPSSGHIKAWVGGRNFRHFKYDHVTSKRQVGSTFKPFLYTVAIDNGWSPCFTVPHLPVSIQNPNGNVWTPKNAGIEDYDGRPVTLKEGLTTSMNNISAYLIKEIGPRPVITLTEQLGLENVPEVNAIALGATEQSVMDMSHAYTAYANQGVSTEPMFIQRIEDKNGNILAEFIPDKKEAISPELAHTMLQMMRNVVTSGTATRLSWKYGLDNFIAGKTGTTDDHSDGWFVGLTPELIGVVWTGCDDPVLRFRSLGLGGGSNMALPIWGQFFKDVYADESLGVTKYSNFKQPDFVSVSMDCTDYLTNNPMIIDDGSGNPIVVDPNLTPIPLPSDDGATVKPEEEDDFD